MKEYLRQVWDAFLHRGPGYDVPPLPQRGDHVEAWLKEQRDQYPDNTTMWDALDNLLDDYRLHADTRTPLDEHVCMGGYWDDCLECSKKDRSRWP